MSPKLENESDEDLLDRYKDGDQRAFEHLLARYRTSVFNFLLRSVRDPAKAEDLLQEVFLRVIHRCEHFERRAKFSTWLYTIARNLCVDTSRKMIHRRHRSLDAPARSDLDGSEPLVERVAASTPTADRDAIAQRLRVEIADAIEELPTDQREVFLMRQVQGLAFKDIATIVGVPENTIKSRMRYALERLQQALSDYDDYARKLS